MVSKFATNASEITKVLGSIPESLVPLAIFNVPVEGHLYHITFNVGRHRLQIVLAGRVIIKRDLAASRGGTRIEYPGQHWCIMMINNK